MQLPHSDAHAGDTYVIRGGVVVDGTGAAGVPADVIIDGERIVDVLPAGSTAFPTEAVVDATGCVVTPGFIDAHSHADNSFLLPEDDLTKIRQGVTTEVVGNCGFSLAPLATGPGRSANEDALRKTFPVRDVRWTSSRELYALQDELGSVTNQCALVGHTALRLAVLGGSGRRPTADELQKMRMLLEEALSEGAHGLSSGLMYAPGVYADVEELAHLTAVLERRVYATHVRNESDGLTGSIAEALASISRRDTRLQISHLKVTGVPNVGLVNDAIIRLDRARADGLQVTHDVYPYTAASTILAACLPPWMQEDCVDATLARLRDPAALAEARHWIEVPSQHTWENAIALAGGYSGILVSATASHAHEGKTLTEIAEVLGCEPFHALAEILLNERLQATMVEFSLSDSDLDAAFASPWTCIGSDGLSPGLGGKYHPRLFGSFPVAIRRFVRERAMVSLPEMIRRVTSLPAEIFGLADRGVIRRGAIADLVCFDPETIDHTGDYSTPEVPVVGIQRVIMAGRTVVENGNWQGTRRGRRLRAS